MDTLPPGFSHARQDLRSGPGLPEKPLQGRIRVRLELGRSLPALPAALLPEAADRHSVYHVTGAKVIAGCFVTGATDARSGRPFTGQSDPAAGRPFVVPDVAGCAGPGPAWPRPAPATHR